MGSIRTSADATFDDYVTSGLPASGVKSPVKSAIRATFGVVEDRIEAVEAIAGAGIRWASQTVRVRSTANVAISTALENGDTLNGVTLATGDHVFLGSQTAPAENGIYTVVASGAASRATWADTAAELALIGFLITEGAVGAGEQWTLPLLAANITVGTTSLVFSRVGVEISLATEVAAVQAAQAEIFYAADRASDPLSPWFFDTAAYTLGRAAPTTAAQATVSTRDSATQLTLASGGSGFVTGGAMAVLDDATGEVTSYMIKSVSGNVITTYEDLPADPSACEAMHKANLDPHLSRLGYYGLADALRGTTIRHSYNKDVSFEYHGPSCASAAFNNPDIYALDGTTLLIDVTALGGAIGGGFVAGTTALTKLCTQDAANRGYGVDRSDYLSRGYLLRDSGVGKGFKFTIPLDDRAGFVKLEFYGSPEAYTTDPGGLSATCAGTYRVKLTGLSGTVYHNQVYRTGELKIEFVDHDAETSAELEITLEEAVPTSVTLCGVRAFPKAPDTPTGPIFEEGDVVAFLGDSWTQFPVPVGAETALPRADGTAGEGMQFLSERLRDRMEDAGTPIKTYNWGMGSTTTAWGRFWVSELINANPRPNKCVIHFYINDAGSVAAYDSDIASVYDFNASNQWALTSSGDTRGSVSYALWYRYTQIICALLAGAGIQPIVMMPGHIASDATGQNIRDNQLGRIAQGFRA